MRGTQTPVEDAREFVTDTVCAVEDIPSALVTCPDELPQWTALYDSVPGGESQDKIRWGQTAAVSGDGTRVFVTGESWAIGDGGNGFDYATLAYDAETGDELWIARYEGPLDRQGQANDLVVSPDGSTVLWSG